MTIRCLGKDVAIRVGAMPLVPDRVYAVEVREWEAPKSGGQVKAIWGRIRAKAKATGGTMWEVEAAVRVAAEGHGVCRYDADWGKLTAEQAGDLLDVMGAMGV